MIILALVILLVLLAGAFKACADTMDKHYDTSVFSLLDSKFWSNKTNEDDWWIPCTSYPVNAWHLANSLSIVCWALAMALRRMEPMHLHWFFELCISGTLFIFSFNLFWDKLLKKNIVKQ